MALPRFVAGLPPERIAAARKAMQPILASTGLFLRSTANDPELESRFASQFAAVWKAIPLRFRRSIARHWRTVALEFCEPLWVPEIVLTRWQPRHRGKLARACYADTNHNGTRFWDDAMRLLPDEWIRQVAAHELAHVYLDASGQNDPQIRFPPVARRRGARYDAVGRRCRMDPLFPQRRA